MVLELLLLRDREHNPGRIVLQAVGIQSWNLDESPVSTRGYEELIGNLGKVGTIVEDMRVDEKRRVGLLE